jgi:hypothetical protein
MTFDRVISLVFFNKLVLVVKIGNLFLMIKIGRPTILVPKIVINFMPLILSTLFLSSKTYFFLKF